MHVVHDRAARLHVEHPADDLAAVLQAIRPLVQQYAELAAMLALVSFFWGVLLYAAIVIALP